jgi:hypothetical protein
MNSLNDRTSEGALQDAKRPYESPTIESQPVLERAALACSGAAFANSSLTLKTTISTCGYNDS